jgi:CRP/FNR family cyclic AMP-dependent transcriptional regulator
MLTTIEKVIFLQEISIFEFTSTEDLAHIAAITDEIQVKSKSNIFKEGDISDAMYMVIEGAVRLHRDEEEVTVAKNKDVFGTWSLFDDEPRIATATTLEDSLLLRIAKEDFVDLLSDHIRITQSVFKALVKSMRGQIYKAMDAS